MDNSNITDDLLAEIERVAKAATPGPWEWFEHGVGEFVAHTSEEHEAAIAVAFVDHDPRYAVHESMDKHRADIRHIASANPATVLAMIHHIRHLQSTRQAAADYLSKSAILPHSILHDRIKESLS